MAPRQAAAEHRRALHLQLALELVDAGLEVRPVEVVWFIASS